LSPAKALAEQFVRRSPATLLALGIALSLCNFGILCAAAAREGVLFIRDGLGLFNNFGLLSTLVGNAISLYVAKRYYDGICSARTSKAVISTSAVEEELSTLAGRVAMRGRHPFLIYGFVTVGFLAWLSNLAGHVIGDPAARWGYKLCELFDSTCHPLTFTANRLHNVYTWMIIMPLLAHVMIYCSFYLRQLIANATREGGLVYDLLNPDRRGGFGFVDDANILFNIVAGLTYVQVTLHIGTFNKMNTEHLLAYIALTIVLIVINRMFLGDIYATVEKLRLAALNKLKDEVYNDNTLSFEILKYCYERRVSALSVINGLIKTAAILIPGIVKLWPTFEKAGIVKLWPAIAKAFSAT
jgi:hypothetical protein